MQIPHPAAVAMTFLSWVAIFAALAVWVVAAVVTAALRWIVK